MLKKKMVGSRVSWAIQCSIGIGGDDDMDWRCM